MRINKKNLIFAIIIITVIIVTVIGISYFFKRTTNDEKVNNIKDSSMESRDACDYSELFGAEKYIVQSRCNTYEKNLYKLTTALADEVDMGDINLKDNEVLIVPFDKIRIEKEFSEKSPFAPYKYSYSFVLITGKYFMDDGGTTSFEDDEYIRLGYNYYIQALDESGVGTKLALEYDVKIKSLAEKELVLLPFQDEIDVDELGLPTSILDSLPETVTKIRVIK